MIKKHASSLALVASITIAAAQTVASTLVPTVKETKNTSEPATQTQRFKTPQPVGRTPTSSQAAHLFPVNDAKGLLLTCTAPEIDTNPDTDVFHNCMLAPGRTLDDVMHTFIGAIHFVQNQQIKELSERIKDLEEKPAQKPEQK